MVLSSHVALLEDSGSVSKKIQSQENLDSLSICRTPVVNVPSSRIAAHKADGADVRVVADEVHTVVLWRFRNCEWDDNSG